MTALDAREPVTTEPMPILSGDPADVLHGDGTWDPPSGGSGLSAAKVGARTVGGV